MLIIKLGPLANYWSPMLFRLQLSHEFTRAQVKLTRAQALVGLGVDTPLKRTDIKLQPSRFESYNILKQLVRIRTDIKL